MESYPKDYVAHNLPLIVLSGLGSPNAEDNAFAIATPRANGGVKIRSPTGIPPITGPRADKLLREFLSADGSDLPWNDRSRGGRGAALPLRVRAVGREYALPPRKAPPPTDAELSAADVASSQVSPWVLHSPVSPLTSSSPLYPDGVMTPDWIAKHQHRIPAAFVSFYQISSDEDSTEVSDKQLYEEIGTLKSYLHDYKIRCAVVLQAEVPAQQIPDLEERLSTLRRITGLDPRNALFLFAPTGSVVELTTFAQATLTSLQPICVEYYRDLTKHARRKKGRGTVPAPTIPPTKGTSQSLPTSGWGVRYDFKLGVFAEFRQEMDSASRHYGIALDSLLGADGIFQTIPSWSPRWDETRLLTDIIAIRLIRCLLWNSLPSSAVQAWSNHRSRTQVLLERKGKGTGSYGWQAWLARWSSIMGELLLKADLPMFHIVEPAPSESGVAGRENLLFVPPEKLIALGERLPPWQQLHHAGYWFSLAAEYAVKRRIAAQDVPEEGRTPPGQSPAAKVANRYDTYDTYLVPPPHIELPLQGNEGYGHCSEAEGLLNKAVSQFFARSQHRYVDQLNLKLGSELRRAKRYSEALSVLKPLYDGNKWRKEEWWDLSSAVVWSLNECATQCEDGELVLSTEWDLLDELYTGRHNREHDFMRCLDDAIPLSAETSKTTLRLTSDHARSCIDVAFAFATTEGNVGEPMPAQIMLRSRCRQRSKPVVLSDVAIHLRGCINEIVLRHDGEVSDRAQNRAFSSVDITLQELSTPAKDSQMITASWRGTTDLTLSPGHTKVISFPLFFRDAGDVIVTETSLNIETERFKFTYSAPREEAQKPLSWWLKGEKGIRAKQLTKTTSTSIHVLPKPPKIEISVPDLQLQYHTDEPLTLTINIANKEDEAAEVVLEVRLLGGAHEALGFSWTGTAKSPSTQAEDSESGSDKDDDEAIDLPGHQVGKMARGETRSEGIKLQVPADPSTYALEIKALYHLISDLETPISKIYTAELAFASPFEASYDFNPRVHPDPWPSYFDPEHALKEAISEAELGVTQTWLLRARIASFAASALILEEASIITNSIQGGTSCTAHPEPTSTTDSTIAPQELQERCFRIDTRKISLEERRASALELSLQIRWRRPSTSDTDSSTAAPQPSIVTTLPIPRLHIPSSEPRVLAYIGPSPVLAPSTPAPSIPIIPLLYTIENPTVHFLTFELTMDASEEFAFSGAKVRALNLVPMSRRTVGYNLLPLVRGAWITPNLNVVDRYFKKNLKVLPCEGLRGEKKGVGVWVDAEE